MIATIEAKNFKCFGETGIHLDLPPLTILLGPNGSGKSSVLDAIGLLSQTAETADQRSGFRWKGPWVNLGDDGRFAFNKTDVTGHLSLTIGFKDGETLTKWQRDRNLSEELVYKPHKFQYCVEYSKRTEEWSHKAFFDEKIAAVYRTVVSSRSLTSASRTQAVNFPAFQQISGLAFNPSESAQAVLSSYLFNGNASASMDHATSEKWAGLRDELALFMDYLKEFLRTKVFFVGADRTSRESFDMRLEPGPLRVGRHGERTLAVLSVLFARPQHGPEAGHISDWGARFGLGRLRAGWVGEKLLEAGYVDPQSQTPLPSHYAGFGSQQILPVITQLFAAPAGSLVLIEEPEISLHPGAQIDAVKMFAHAIHEGRQIVITTHSQTLLLALPEAAREYGLKPEDVALYHFSRDNGETKAKKLDVDDEWYVKGWVPSFSNVESQLLKQWMAYVRGKTDPRH